jgi:hypothetical protein
MQQLNTIWKRKSVDFKVLDLGLVYYTNVMDNPQKVIDLAEDVARRVEAKEHGAQTAQADGWEPWWDEHMPKPFNYRKNIFRSRDISPECYYKDEMMELGDTVFGALDRAFEHYCSIYPFAKNNIKSEELGSTLLRYDGGGHLPPHQDHGISSRVLSAVMYLNDNYDGGEIEFRQSGVKIKPEAGSIVFFPSNFLYVHEVFEVTDGSRYAMPHWYHNMAKPIMSNGQE